MNNATCNGPKISLNSIITFADAPRTPYVVVGVHETARVSVRRNGRTFLRRALTSDIATVTATYAGARALAEISEGRG